MSFMKYNISLYNFTKQEKFRKNNQESFFEPPISNSYLKYGHKGEMAVLLLLIFYPDSYIF